MPKVSIIMPSLNVSAYICECMDSVVNQTLQDIEIVCVDAASTDGTWEILEEYAQKDSRVRLIRSEKRSYGHQMNLGLKAATGEYIGIVETDDFILPQMYQELYSYAQERDADFVKSDFDIFTSFPDGERIFLRYSLEKNSGIRYDTQFTAMDYISRKQTVDIFIWNGIYKREFLEKNHIVFQETPGAAFQDCGFRYQVALWVKKGFFIGFSYYCYRRDNVSSSTYSSKCVLYNLAECKSMLERAQEEKYSQEQMSFLAREVAVIALCPYIELLAWGKVAEETKDALKEFRGILDEFIAQGILSRKTVAAELWMEIRMFVEYPDLYDCYAHLKAEMMVDSIKDFIELIANKEDVVLFGSGYVGTSVYCLLRNNGIQNVSAFCDNDQKKWGGIHLGLKVEAPEKIAEKRPNAYYIITVGKHAEEIVSQLYNYGIPRSQMMVYRLTTSPMDCTNMGMRVKKCKPL